MIRFLTILICVVACGGELYSEEPTTPRFQGDSLPLPPQQAASWTPPKTRLSSRLIAATRTLFSQGLADPRGCEYREIETNIGGVGEQADDEGIFKSHGWVLPADPARQQRFAIRWDGLIYPVRTIGPAVDLRAEFTETTKKPKRLLIRLCLLLRLGESQLAEKYFDAVAGEKDRDELCDPYLLLAREWTGALFHRVAIAHMCGDDRLALLTARALVPIWEAVEIEAAELDLPMPEHQSSDDYFSGEVFWDASEVTQASRDRSSDEKTSGEASCADDISCYLGNLKPLRFILADQERRATQRRQKKGESLHLHDVGEYENVADFWKQVEGKLGRRLDNSQRIAIVIRWFEETKANNSGEMARLLAPYRDEAVEPLLKCLQNDTRLTRGGDLDSFEDRFRREGVDQIAYKVLCEILETHFDVYVDSTLMSESRSSLAARIRAHWHKIRNMSPADGWYEVLRDDSQSPDRWVTAVHNTIVSRKLWSDSEKKEAAARRETLRTKRNPSMTELLVKRARNLAEQGSMEPASQIALALADWDPEAALPILRQQTTCWPKVLCDQSPKKDHSIHWIPHGLVQLTLARAKLKDALALPDYMQILRKMSRNENSVYDMNVFAPLLQYPEDPDVVAGADWMFNDPTSPWNPSNSLIHGPSLGRNPLMILPAFRKRVLRGLADTTVVKTMVVVSHEKISIPGYGHNTKTYAGDPLCPPPGSRVKVRRCDLCAEQLKEICGMPCYELFWPKARRDQAVAQCSRLLQQYGHLLTKPGEFAEVPFTFPLLDHPATLEDVRSGKAIFSLEGKGTVRCCKLIRRPASARWVTFREEPFAESYYVNGKAAKLPRVGYHQDGVVWQAEEVLVDGKWHRYYGFIGAGRMAKVPAEEIEFDVPGARWNNTFHAELTLWELSLQIVNHSGVPQPVPHFHAADDRSPAPPGSTIVDFHAYRYVGPLREPPFSDSLNFPDPAIGEDRQWREIPRKPGIRLKLNQLPDQLQPMEAAAVFTMNLDAAYPKFTPGNYREAAEVVTNDGSRKTRRFARQGYTPIKGDSSKP